MRDRDAVYGRDFGSRAGRIGIDAIAPIHAPKANAVAERVIGTHRRECLDHLIILDEQHLAMVLTEFVGYSTQSGPTGRCASRRRSRRHALSRGQCDPGPCSAVCTTCTSRRPDPSPSFAPPQAQALTTNSRVSKWSTWWSNTKILAHAR